MALRRRPALAASAAAVLALVTACSSGAGGSGGSGAALDRLVTALQGSAPDATP